MFYEKLRLDEIFTTPFKSAFRFLKYKFHFFNTGHPKALNSRTGIRGKTAKKIKYYS
jgi:hypothetical protein